MAGLWRLPHGAGSELAVPVSEDEAQVYEEAS
jgi:hypothetical protein